MATNGSIGARTNCLQYREEVKVPLLTLGIPANPVMAILLGALMIHGLQPGPLLMKNAPDLFGGPS
jgi:TctA family transporter